MAATRRTASFLRLSSRMKSPQLLLATIAISSSWSSVPLAESFSIRSHQKQRTSGLVYRQLHLPPRNHRPVASSLSDDAIDGTSNHESVTGPIYEVDDVPTVKLFTKQGCTLCDKVKDVLESVRGDEPHSLLQVDITDDDKQEWFSKYKYDIPVLHINDTYWTKHKLSTEDAITGIEEASTGDFEARQGEPDASKFEHN
ncbi:hypothetical protein ACHAXR_008455 [Thalassiosira sp. AJA248-18]